MSEVPPFHLVVYSDARAPGGAEMTLGTLLAALPPQVRLSVVAVDESVGSWLIGDRPGARLVVIEPIEGRSDLRGMWRHRRLFQRLRGDIVQFNLSMMSSCQWAMFCAQTIRGARTIAVENSPLATWSPTSRRLKRWTSDRLAAHVAVGESTSRLIEHDAQLRPHSVRTLYHGVPDVATAGSDVTKGATRRIVNVARHDPVKGIDVLVRTMLLLPADVHLTQIGSGPETASIEALIGELHIDDRIELIALPWDERAADRFCTFDAFVLPSRLEGLPVTIMEAMLAGIPVVATDVGSVREAVQDGVTGRVVPPEDPAALADAVLDVLDPRTGAEMGLRAREVALTKFTVAATVDAYLQIYDEVLARR